MKYLVTLFSILLLSILTGIAMTNMQGYLLIVYQHWSIKTTLPIAAFCFIVLFSIFYFTCRLLGWITRISVNIARWKKTRRNYRSQRLTLKGLRELAEGRWYKAEQTLLKAARLTDAPLINYLGAAEAANAQQNYERRDNYLRAAYLKVKKSKTPIKLAQAQLQINSHQLEQALATLQQLNSTHPNNPRTLELLKHVYLKLSDWKNLRELLPRLRKYKIDSSEKLDILEKDIYLHLLIQAKDKNDQSLLSLWNSFPRRFHSNPELAYVYIQYLINNNESNKAIAIIENVLAKQWNAPLINVYGLISGEKKLKQLTTAETWLKKYPTESALFLCVGRLSLREKFLGKAHDYLQKSIHLSPTSAAYQELGRVYEMQNQTRSALDCYKKALYLEP